MKCPKCKEGVEIKKRQVGLDEYHDPVYNEFAICKSCKKQWNIDKIRAKKAEALDRKRASEAVAELRPIGYKDSNQEKKSTKSGSKTPGKPANKSRNQSSADIARKSTRKASGSSRSRRKQKPALLPVRIAFCVVSLVGFAYWIVQGFRAGLDSIEGTPSEYSGIYIILAICFLVAAVFWWLMRGNNALYVYFLPMTPYLIGVYVTFSHRAEASHLLVATIASAIFSILCVIVAALAKTVQS